MCPQLTVFKHPQPYLCTQQQIENIYQRALFSMHNFKQNFIFSNNNGAQEKRQFTNCSTDNPDSVRHPDFAQSRSRLSPRPCNDICRMRAVLLYSVDRMNDTKNTYLKVRYALSFSRIIIKTQCGYAVQQLYMYCVHGTDIPLRIPEPVVENRTATRLFARLMESSVVEHRRSYFDKCRTNKMYTLNVNL